MPAGYGVGGYDGSGTEGGMDSGMGISPGEAPSNRGGDFSKIGKAVKDMVFGKGKTYNMAMNPNKVSYTQNFLQGSLPKDYTVSESGNTVYARTEPSARELAMNRNTGIPDKMAFRGAVAGINPETGMMWSGASKDGALDQFTNSMMTPQRAEQNRSRTAKYADRSNKMRGQLRGSGVVPRTGKEGAFGFLDLDKDGGIFTSTDPYGTVYGMSNKAIYDPSLPEAYRGIPGTYAAKSGEPQKISEDRMLANQVMSYITPGAGIARLGNYVNNRLFGETETDNQVAPKINNDNNLVSGPDNLTDAQILSEPSNQYMVQDYLMPTDIIGYRPDGTPVTESDLDANQYRGVGMQ
jgi:hypothetical protein